VLKSLIINRTANALITVNDNTEMLHHVAYSCCLDRHFIIITFTLFENGLNVFAKWHLTCFLKNCSFCKTLVNF